MSHTPASPKSFTLDIGGEGRHSDAWNLNPSRVKTVGPERGAPIPRLILGRAESIPLPDSSVDLIIVERTHLRTLRLVEMRRILAEHGTIVLRHAVAPDHDPHRLAYQHLPDCEIQQIRTLRGGYVWQETVFRSKKTALLPIRLRPAAQNNLEDEALT